MSPPSSALRGLLLEWFDRHQRALPWRATRDPYAIWVSEVMLQQTQVDRVVPYYRRFLAAFPTVGALAAAPIDDVLSVWSGLGYYSRARNLHRAAQVVVERHAGTLPASLEQLLELPGFGRYTAGAVASIAFGLPAPLVDGNVARVFARLFEIDGAPGDKTREHQLWARAAELVPGARPGDLNQSLMELGATLCTPTNPMCLLCPVQAHCGAFAHGRVEELPPPKKSAPKKRLDFAVAVAQRGGGVLLARRHERGLFGGLWEMPCAPMDEGGNGYAALRELLGKGATIGPELSILERTLTHRRLVLHLIPVALPSRLKRVPESYDEWRWVPREATKALGISSAMEAALDLAAPLKPVKPSKKRR